jgi:hypothetical protein
MRKTPFSSSGSLPKYLFSPGAVTLVGAVVILSFRYQRKGKVKKSRYLFYKEQEKADKTLKTFKSLKFSFTFAD